MAAEPALSALRGPFPKRKLHARLIAEALENPGCGRRRVLDAAEVDLDRLGVLMGGPEAHQSGFALRQGNTFERQVTDNGLAVVIDLVRKHLGFDIPHVRQLDLSVEAVKLVHGSSENGLRVKLTRAELKRWLTGDPGAYNLLRHAMTSLRIGGTTVYLEQDILAFMVGDQLVVVEIKSFPAIDGRADPEKVGASARQSAVYVISLQETVTSLGFDPMRVSLRSLLILPMNFSFTASGHVVDLRAAVARLRRQLESTPAIEDILEGLPDDLVLPALPDKNATAEQRRSAVTQAGETLSAIPPRFGEACVNCPLFTFCRGTERLTGSTAQLGSAVSNACGDVGTVQAALDLARGSRPARTASERALAEVLGRAAAIARRYGIA